jgi:probable F420-dependent oxidoreductase
MGLMQPFRFMVATRGILDRPTLIERARRAESVGYDAICIHDHLTAQLAPTPVLTAVAMATERLRLCPLVFNNDLRHPAVLAQELSTLDLLSDGRLIAGIGAGWNEREYGAIGLPFDRPGTRIDRLEEAIAILRGSFADGPFSFDGRFYSISDFDCQPKPVQRPHPPFLIGGTRERVLRLATREADIVGMDLRQDREALLDALPAGMDRRVGWVSDEAGDRFEGLELSVLRVLGDLVVTDRPLAPARALASSLSDRTGLSITAEEVLESPYTLIGSVTDLVDKLRRGRQRWGINSILVGWFDDAGLPDLDPVVEQLAGT